MKITEKDFNTGYHLITIENESGFHLSVTDLGARIVSLGRDKELVLGFDSTDDYLEQDPFIGASIGRTAGRIENGRFTLAGKDYQVSIDPATGHSLHGGKPGFETKKWTYTIENGENEASVMFTTNSPDGEHGFPGNLDIEVRHTLTQENVWRVTTKGISDQTTLFNPTNHVYFNLTGNPTIPIDAHELQINAQKFVPLDERVLPLGELASVDQTAFDLQKPKKLAEVFSSTDEQIQDLINPDVILKSPTKDITLEMFTDQPSVVIFSANFADNGPDIQGQKLVNHGALTFETQVCPGAERFPLFGSITLSPEQEFHSTTRFKLIY